MSKKNILIFIQTAETLRSYIGTNAFEEIEKAYNVYYLLPAKKIINDYPSNEKIYLKDHRFFTGKNIILHNFDTRNYFFRRLFKILFIYRASRYSDTYAAYFFKPDGKLRSKKLIVYQILATKYIYRFLTDFLEKLIPLSKELIRKTKKVSPFLLIVPGGSAGNADIDLLKVARKLKIKYTTIIITWDCISSKAYYYLTPDFVLERGNQNAEFARKILEIDENRVKVVGSPQYDIFFKYQQRSDLKERRIDYLTKLGVPTGKDIVLFGGSLRPFDETSFLEKLEDAIELGSFKNIHILYRPHFDRDRRIKEKSFFDMHFKHITFDEELKFAYLHHKSNVVPDLDNYPDLYNSIIAIISPPTSIMLEAAFFGKPVLGLVCDDGVHYGWTSAQMIVDREHFKIWKGFNWFVRCHHKEYFMEDCKKLINIAKTPGINEKVKSDLKYIIHTDNKSYSERILEAVKDWE